MMAEVSSSETNNAKAESLQISLAKKKECFNKAKTVVEQLLEENVSESLLLGNVQFITQSDYLDVVEERVILKLCGYAICKNKLENVPKKKFHISTTSNRVYDISERKKFCSNLCYKASLYLKEQVLTSPVWFRDYEETPQFHLLPTHEKKGQIGEEVFLDISKIALKSEKNVAEINNVEFVSGFALNALKELEKVGGPCYESLFIKEKYPTQANEPLKNNLENPQQQTANETIKYNNFQQELSNETVECSSTRYKTTSEADIVSETESNKLIINLTKPNSEKRAQKDLGPEASKIMPPIRVQQIKQKQHSNLETDKQNCKVLNKSHILELGEHIKPLEAPKSEKIDISNKQTGATKKLAAQATTNKVIKQGFERVKEVSYQWFTLESAIYLYGMDHVVKSLLDKANHYETKSEIDQIEATKIQFFKLCKELEEKTNKLATENNVQIKQDLTDLELKVKAFYEGKTRITPALPAKEQEVLKPILPDVDRYSQKAARQKIVFSRLSKVLSDLFEIFDISTRDISSEVRSLLETFEFAANNIMLKPNEWNLMGLLIIKMVSVKDPELKQELSTKKRLKCLAMMLKSFELNPDFLDNFINNLCGLGTSR